MKRTLSLVAAVTFFLLYSVAVYAQEPLPSDRAVLAEAIISKTPPRIILRWKPDTATTSIQVFRRLPGAASWGAAHKVANKDSLYTDSTVTIGTEYEYRISRNRALYGSTVLSSAYLRSGIDIHVGDDHGRCILLVDSTYATPLKKELDRLRSDLFAEGYIVIRIDVDRKDAVPAVKQKLAAYYPSSNQYPTTLFIIGHVPVPYSGFLAPDGHPNHYGAWPTDMYYSEFDGDWTDDYEDTTSGILPANRNLIGDGKFDQLSQPDDIDWRTGRVDLYNLPAFSKSDTALMKQYLDKDHDYRMGKLTAPERGMTDTHFGYMGGEAFAASGWRNFAPLVGIDSVRELPWFSTLPTNPYLFAYGTGPGSDNSVGGIGTTNDFASKDSKAIFTMLFGSYFGDWNVVNNVLRAPLATSYGLTCVWSGRPYWQYFPVGLGHTFGDATILTQNSDGDYDAHIIGDQNGAYLVQVNLMGDPTLRLRPYAHADQLLHTTSNAATRQYSLDWEFDASLLGYNVYRASVKDDHFTLLTPAPIKANSYADKDPLSDSMYYLVRGVKDETTPSGNYLNLALGSWTKVEGMEGSSSVDSRELQDRVTIDYTATTAQARLILNNAGSFTIEILNAAGARIYTVASQYYGRGENILPLPLSELTSGMYFIHLHSSDGRDLTQKMVIQR